MKIAILHGPRDLRIEEQPLDGRNLEPDQIWVETLISALKIGTDRGNYEGAEPVPGAPDYPRWVGDSNLGVIRGVGRRRDAISRWRPGRWSPASPVRICRERITEHREGPRGGSMPKMLSTPGCMR